MAECVKCGSYTKFNNGLCHDCYQDREVLTQPSKGHSKPETCNQKTESTDNPWSYNLIKGRIAETLIEELFLSLQFQVFKYGMENTIPGIMKLLKGVKDEVAMGIKRMPDLVVYKDSRV